jgi:hypothetical protein
MGIQPISVPQALAQALDAAGSRSGVDFDYLLQTAMRESSLNPQAKASTSSAVGLFQFLEGTWLQVVKEEGARLGYGAQAAEIERTRDGDYVVRDPARRAQLLKLREDPQMAADMAAAFTRSNGDYLHQRFGRMPSAGELYIAHFLGASGAERMFTAGLANPDQSAVALFPRQADANPSIFFESGKPLTVREVYRRLVAKHEGGGATPAFAAQQLSGTTAPTPAPNEPPVDVVPSRYSGENVSFTGLFRTAPEATSGLPDLALPGETTHAPFFTQLYGR